MRADPRQAPHFRRGSLDHGDPDGGHVGLLFSPLGAAAEAGPAMAAAKPAAEAKDPMVQRGEYLVKIGGCNDCHTAGYPETGGNVPKSEWLMGAPVGFKGAWGTSYAANLRLTVAALTEDQGGVRARSAPPAHAVVQPA